MKFTCLLCEELLSNDAIKSMNMKDYCQRIHLNKKKR